MDYLWFFLGLLLGALPMVALYEVAVRRRLRAARDQATAALAAQQAAVAEQEGLITALRAEAGDVQARLHETLGRLEQESAARRDGDHQLRRTLAAVERIRGEHEATIAALEATLAKRTREARGVVGRLERELTAVREVAERRQFQLQRLQAELEALEAERDGLALQLSDAIGGVAGLEARAEAAEAEQFSLRAQLAVAEDQIAVLEERLQDVEGLIGRFPVQQMEIRRLDEALQRSKGEQQKMGARLREAAAVARTLEQRYRQALHHMRRLLAGKRTPPPAGGNGERPPPPTAADALAELRRVNGIGPTYARRLVASGIATLAQLADASPEALSDAAGLSSQQATRAQDWIAQARVLRQEAGLPPHLH